MTFKEAMREIESHEFAARLNVASDLRSFLRAAQARKAVRILLLELDSPEKRQELFFRILELPRRRVDPRYENQWDTALAVYVWLINSKDFNLAKIAAEAVAQAPQCWWATKVSRYILRGTLVHNDANVDRREVISLSSILATATEKTDGGEVILHTSFLDAMTKLVALQPKVNTSFSLQADTVVTYEWPPQHLEFLVLPRNIDSHQESLAL